MPRVDGTYAAPYPDVIPDTTIESEVHNGTVADLVLDANAPRPVTAGGTGATSPATARDNLDAMVAGAQVTNYDSHLWENGSFWSAAGATGAPNAGAAFTGLAAMVNSNQNTVSLLATDQITGLNYSRVKNTTWDVWVVTDLSDKVSITGDTMIGDLAIEKVTPLLELKGTSTSNGVIAGAVNGLRKWDIALGLAIGGDLIVNSYDDAGASLGQTLRIERVSRKAMFAGNIEATGSIGSTSFVSGTQFTGINNTTYQLTLQHTTQRHWGIGITTGENALQFQDLTAGQTSAKITAWDGTYATLILPRMTTTAVAPNCAVSTTTGTFIFSSSRRYKTDIQPLEDTDADKLMLLDAVSYKSTSPVDDKDRRWYGFIAEDVDKVDPLLVHRDYPRDGAQKVPEGVDYTRITVLAVHKVQTQEKRIKAQEERIAELLARLEALEAR